MVADRKRTDRGKRMSMTGDLVPGPAAGGLVFTGCEMQSAAAAGPPAHGHDHAHPRRREVVVNGKRVKTVDVHAHCIVPDGAALINHPLEAPGLLMDDTSDAHRGDGRAGHRCRGAQHQPVLVPRRARRGGRADQGPERDAGRVLRRPSRSLRRLRDGGAAASRPRRASRSSTRSRNSGFRGVGVAGSVAGEELANPKFHPFWAKCEELGVLVFMHPLGTRELEPSGRLAGSGLLTNTIGNPLETTIALSHLIFEGTLDRFPGLKICAAHGGGFLPSYANRSDAVIRPSPTGSARCPRRTRPNICGRPALFDTIVFTPRGACAT